MNFTTQKLNLLYVVVVANSSLKDTVQDFVKFKESQGFEVVVEDVPTIEQNYQGIDCAEKIRNFLKDKTKDYPKSFTLLIGKPYDKEKATDSSTGGEIPMRIITSIFINYFSHLPETFSYPTDFYYADLEGNWDKNNNGKYGEIKFDETIQKGEKIDEVDEQVHNFVGRIPFSEKEVVKSILVNTINIQNIECKNKALLAMAKSEGRNLPDLAEEGEWLIENIFKPAGFNVTTLYEKEGSKPSLYNCTAPLNNENFITYFPGNDIVITTGENGINREVWYDYNGDGQVQEYDYSVAKSELKFPPILSLDGLRVLASQGVKTKIFFEWGCESWNYNDNVSSNYDVNADDILRAGISAVVVGTTKRVGSGSISDLESFCNTIITAQLPIGEWLYNIKYPRTIIRIPGPSDFWWQRLAYNILGDPSFSLFDDSLTISADLTPPTIQITSPSNGSITNKTEVTISGIVSEVGSGIQRVEINSNSVTLTDDSFNTVVKLEEGKNTVTVKAVDKAGNETTT
ncbi:MAG: C25 family cysteine peptidase, partial [Caldanaerobacter sp.]